MSKGTRVVFTLCLILVLISSLVFLTAGFLSRHYAVAILMYHSVNPSAQEENRLSVTADLFERQMRFLKEHHYNVVSLESLVALLKAKKGIPFKTVAITFDDGYKDNYTYAYPILKKYQLPATIFIIVQEVGRKQDDRLSWEEIKEMRPCGLITFGSHAVGPDPLYKMNSEEQLRRQIFDSKRMIEDKLGREVFAFSYPEGMFDDHIKKLVEEAGYRMAVATRPAKKYASDDLFALRRQRISSRSGSAIVFWAQASGYYSIFQGKKHKK